MRALLATPLADPQLERLRASHHDAIRELQGSPLAGARILTARLADGVETPIAHGLGRAPRFALLSIVRGAASTGRVVEIRSGTADRAKFLTVQADGWGATIELEVMVL